jgi:hypothetical protein
MITPTNGRIVWFRPQDGDTAIQQHDIRQPLAAQVCHVWGDRMVNLLVTDRNGTTHAQTSVQLLQDDDLKPEGGRFCFWMPYQKGQAAKTEVAEAAAKTAG